MKLDFDPQALSDLRYWAKHNKKIAAKIERLIKETLQTPFTGLGKPEPLKHEYRGCWARRIDQKHRLVYRVEKNTLVILSCRYHY